jgi:hypothetical protein
MTDSRFECLKLLRQSGQYLSLDRRVTNWRARSPVWKVLSSLKITRSQSSISQCKCSRAHLRRLRRLIHEINDLRQITQRRKLAFRSTRRIVVSDAWISSFSANFMYEALLSSAELVTARTSRRTSLTLSFENRSDREFSCVRVESELMIRRTLVRNTSVSLLISDIVKWESLWRVKIRWRLRVSQWGLRWEGDFFGGMVMGRN